MLERCRRQIRRTSYEKPRPEGFLDKPICPRCGQLFEKSSRKCPSCGLANQSRVPLVNSWTISTIAPIILLVLSLIVAVVALLILVGLNRPFDKALSLLADIVTVIAIFIGGYWAYMLFVRKRQKYPRAHIEHACRHFTLPDGRILLHLELRVTNSGEVLLTLSELDIWIGQVLPWPTEIPWPKQESLEASLSRIEKTNVTKTGNGEIEWPLLHGKTVFFNAAQQTIEPGEEDEMHFDFSIPGDTKCLHIYTHLRNVPNPRKEVGWPKTSFYDLDLPTTT